MHGPIPIYAAFLSLFVCILVSRMIVQRHQLSFDPKGRLGCIDGLRGILALGVYFHHFYITYYYHINGMWKIPSSRFYTLTGHVGVALFFMVTGFLFWNRILISRGRIDWKKLFIARFFRLVPLYWVVVSAVILIVLSVGGFVLKTSTLSLCRQLVYWFSFREYPDINAFKDTSLIIAAVFWTLRYEWLFYFSLPVLAMVLRSSKNRPYIGWIVFIAILIPAVKGIEIQQLDFDCRYALFFLVGASAAMLYSYEKWRLFFQTRLISVLATTALLLIFLIFKSGNGVLQAVLLAIFFLPVAMGNSFWGVLKSRSFTLLGELSYSLYLLHGLVLYVVFSVLFPHVMRPGTSSVVLIVAMCFCGGILVLFSYGSFELIEKTGIRFGKEILSKTSLIHGRTI